MARPSLSRTISASPAPTRSTSASSIQPPPARACPCEKGGWRPPASSAYRQRGLGRERVPGPGAGQPGGGKPRCRARVAGRTNRHWPPGGGRRRRCGFGRGGYVIGSVGCSFSGVGYGFRKPLSQKHTSTLWPTQATIRRRRSVDWGLALKAVGGISPGLEP